jgi:polyisoprenoid-binding protein YceI
MMRSRALPKSILLVCSLLVAVLLLRPSLAQTTQPASSSPARGPSGTAFSFKDPKGVNTIGFFIDSQLEPIMGMGTGVAGTIHYDPANPQRFSGTITLSAENLIVGSQRMTAVMQGADWLGVDQFPLVSFVFESARVEKIEGRSMLMASGTLTVAGQTKPIRVPLSATLIEDGAAKRGAAEAGDLLVLRSKFKIDRKDFGIKVDMPYDRVGKQIVITVAIAGYEQ